MAVIKPAAARRRAQFFVLVAACIVLFFLVLNEHIDRSRRFAININAAQAPEVVYADDAALDEPQAEGTGALEALINQQHDAAAPQQPSEGVASAPAPPPIEAAAKEASIQEDQHRDEDDHACAHLPGAADTLVILKTGATEARTKLPVHFNTTFRCAPHHVVFSDVRDEIDGRVLHDVLADVDPFVKAVVGDFDIYHKMQAWAAGGDGGRANFETRAQELHDQAWTLDKWKFLPMLAKALRARPQAKWFVFVEADTHLVWSNLMLWLQRFDPEKPWYIGGQTWLEDTPFAHGGTGFVISNPALNMVVDAVAADPEKFTRMTKDAWAGDFVLAKAMLSVGVKLTESWPIFQGETPESLDYTGLIWCRPVVSYHHMKPDWIKTMWNYERSWTGGDSILNESAASIPASRLPSQPIRHKDVFEHFTSPLIAAGQKQHWDNRSNRKIDFRLAGDSDTERAGSCRELCHASQDCLQWLYESPETCKLGNEVRMGAARERDTDGTERTSGWMVDRVSQWVKERPACGEQDWILNY